MFLKCEKDYGDEKIISWVSAAIRLNVRRLTLLFSLTESYNLFHSLNGCLTLVKLTLIIDSELCLSDNFSLPNLKTLDLRKFKLTVNDEYKDFVTELIEGCPELENLCLMDCDMQTFDYLCIESPRLKSLKIEGSFTDSICDLILDAPNLEVLVFADSVAWSYTVSKFKSLLVAHIDVGPSQKLVDEAVADSFYEDDGSWQFDNCVAELVTACSNTISLYLAAASIGGFTENAGGYADFKNLVPDSPICLEIHMKKIEFGVFKGEEDEIKLVEYFLKNGEVL